jgi:hypothetical protein
MPTYAGLTMKAPEYKDFFIGADITAVSARDTVSSCGDVRSIRK